MKNLFLKQLLLLFIFISVSVAQSDFRVTQEFKSKQRSFEIAIEYAKSITELEKIKREISEFRSEYRGSKDLLNKSLYPENFESSFKILDKKIRYSNKKLSEINKLSRSVYKLHQENISLSDQLASIVNEVSDLRRRNSNLMVKLGAFKNGYGGSKKTIDSLNNLIADLRGGITQRDTLIKEIMDNIFMTTDHRVEDLDNKQLEGLKGKIKKTSLIENIRSLVDDNVSFLNSSTLKLKDLTELRAEFNDFDARWSHFGPKLFDIYAKDKSNNLKLLEIDSLISGWDNTLNVAIWNSIHELFNSHNIVLDHFESGDEFEKVAIDFINEEINNLSGSDDVTRDQKYVFFAEKVWNDEIKKNWLPLLLSNNLLSEQQQQNIDHKLTKWKENIGSSKSYLIYGIIGLLALIIIGSLFFISKKNREVQSAQITDLEDDIIEIDLDSSEKSIDDDLS